MQINDKKIGLLLFITHFTQELDVFHPEHPDCFGAKVAPLLPTAEVDLVDTVEAAAHAKAKHKVKKQGFYFFVSNGQFFSCKKGLWTLENTAATQQCL